MNYKLTNGFLKGTVQLTNFKASDFGESFIEFHLRVNVTPIGGIQQPHVIPIFIDKFTKLGTLANINFNTKGATQVDMITAITFKGSSTLLSNRIQEVITDRTPPPTTSFVISSVGITYNQNNFVRATVLVKGTGSGRLDTAITKRGDLVVIKGKNQSFTVQGEVTLTQAIELPSGSPDSLEVHQGAVDSNGKPSSNVIRTPVTRVPVGTRDCDCCTGFDNASTRKIPLNEPCPACGICENKPTPSSSIPKITIAAIIAGALLPLGRKL